MERIIRKRKKKNLRYLIIFFVVFVFFLGGLTYYRASVLAREEEEYKEDLDRELKEEARLKEEVSKAKDDLEIKKTEYSGILGEKEILEAGVTKKEEDVRVLEDNIGTQKKEIEDLEKQKE